jgi:hypothetical protein
LRRNSIFKAQKGIKTNNNGKLNNNSSFVQRDEDLPRPLPLDEDQDPRMAFDSIVFTEGNKFKSELQIEVFSLEKNIGCEDRSRTDTQASLETIVNSVPKNKALSSRETKIDKNNQFGSAA